MGSLGLIALGCLAACGIDTAAPPTPPAGYRDVVDLFDHGIARTCSLNNGVCHNSNTYPDLHTVANLIDTIGRPCNVEALDRTGVNDACEWPADHLVIASAGVDARIVTAELAAEDLAKPYSELRHVTLALAPAPAGLATGATDTEVHRGTTVFAVGDFGARVVAVDGARVTLDLDSAYGAWTAKSFFDVRVWPPGPLRLHVGDPNGDGIEGALGPRLALIAPGDPGGSYLMKRLVDDTFGELMPRQCRTWDDAANQTLACWITGLVMDGDGRATNAYDPIDYAQCTMRVAGLGRCN